MGLSSEIKKDSKIRCENNKDSGRRADRSRL